MISRRKFLHQSFVLTLGGLAGALTGCSSSQSLTPPEPTLGATPLPAPGPTSTPAPLPGPSLMVSSGISPSPVLTTRIPPSPTPGQAYLSVARGKGPEVIVRAAVDALGGITRFVKSGNDVIIKPNICSAMLAPEYAATTNPEVVVALVKMCLEAGARRVRVMDQPFSGTAPEAYEESGIQAAVERAGGQMELMSEMKYVTVNFAPPARDLKSWKVYQDVLKADVLINVPIAKTHSLAKLTLGMKNLMGVITNRGSIHNALDQRVADLSTVIKPTLNVIDAVRVLARNGPTSWNLKDVVVANTIIASHDIVAADAYATRLLFSKRPEDIGYLKLGADMGLGRFDFQNLLIKQMEI